MGLGAGRNVLEAAFTGLPCPSPRRGIKPLGDALGRFPAVASMGVQTSRERALWASSTCSKNKGFGEYNQPMGVELFLPNSFPIHLPRKTQSLVANWVFRFLEMNSNGARIAPESNQSPESKSP